MALRSTIGRPLAWVALTFAVVALLLLMASGPGTRMGLWNFRSGLHLLKWVAYGGIAAGVLGLLGAILGGARGISVLALFAGLAALAVPIGFRRIASGVPAIHDISTDTQDPPAFRAVLPHRAKTSNPPEYDGPEVAQKQQQAYPDLRPLVLPDPPARVFERAVAAARGLGWEVVDVSPNAAEGRIEATDTTFWFGFKDDVVVRVRPEGTGTRVDVRSKSRVGRSDVGANARRIRRFLEKLQG